MKGSNRVRIIEVGLRDGLQNEKTYLDVDTRIELAKKLALSGLTEIELAAFVSPKWVPQMAGSSELVSRVMQMQRNKLDPGYSAFKKVRFSAIVPNPHGLQAAKGAGIGRVAIFAAATESFSEKNINCSIKESLVRYREVVRQAKLAKMSIRGYLSMCFGCPFEGKVSEAKVVKLAESLFSMGCDEISIGDTIGVADPVQVRRLGKALKSALGKENMAMHFHDTRGTALANILTSLDIGITSFDASLGGLGGCPYAPAATGNVATEDVVYMLHRMGIRTGLNLESLIETSRWLQPKIGRELPSKVARAGVPRIIPMN